MVARKAFSGIIPTRFLTLLAHLIILAVLLWDQVSRSIALMT